MISQASAGLSCLPNEVVHQIADYAGKEFVVTRFSNRRIYLVSKPPPIYPFCPPATLDCIVEFYREGNTFIPIPFIGPVRYVYTFKLPTWWSTAFGIHMTEIMYQTTSGSYSKFNLYIIDLEGLTGKQARWVWKAGSHYSLCTVSLSQFYDSFCLIRSGFEDTLASRTFLYSSLWQRVVFSCSGGIFSYMRRDTRLLYIRGGDGDWLTLNYFALSVDENSSGLLHCTFIERNCRLGEVISVEWKSLEYAIPCVHALLATSTRESRAALPVVDVDLFMAAHLGDLFLIGSVEDVD